jgi:MFS family permease
MSESVPRRRIFVASFVTLIAGGIGFAVRGGILREWGNQFGFTQLELGTITGGGLVGFGVVILVASQIIDRVGYKIPLVAAFVLHGLSAIVTLAATPTFNAFGPAATYWCLYVGMFMFAVANGLCEGVINPLAATLYSRRKTHFLNVLHAGWPAGLVLGGLLGQLIVGRVPWEVPMALFLVPVAVYGAMILGARFPVSEARAAGVGYGQMLRELASPLLLVLLVLQAGVGYVELGTDSWITNITNSILLGQGFLLFVYASSIMFVLRFFAGPIVERINPLGLLFCSAVVGGFGLLLLGSVRSAALVWVAVTVYGIGKTFLWPTMLGVVGERFPRGGAVTMGAIGAVGVLSAGLLGGPGIGYKQDLYASRYLRQEAPGAYDRYAARSESHFGPFPAIRGLDGAKVGVLLEPDGEEELERSVQLLDERGRTVEAITRLDRWWEDVGRANAPHDREAVAAARIYGGRMALKWTAVVPAGLAVGYLVLLLWFRRRGGYRPVELAADGEGEASGKAS